MVAIDAMHTLCLGVHQQIVLWALWALLDKLPVTGNQRRTLSQANRHEINMSVLRREYKDWLKQTHRQNPEMVLTAVGDLTLDLVGTKAKPVLKTKAHETLTLTKWLNELLPKHQGVIPRGDHWVGAVKELCEMWRLMDTTGMSVPEATQKDWRKKISGMPPQTQSPSIEINVGLEGFGNTLRETKQEANKRGSDRVSYLDVVFPNLPLKGVFGPSPPK